MAIQTGQVLKVLRGTFKGMDARVVSVDGDSVEVAVSVFGREAPATLEAVDLGGTPLERKADRLLTADANLGHQLRSRAYWKDADVSNEAKRVEAWAAFLEVQRASEAKRDAEAGSALSDLAKAHDDNGDALRAVEDDTEHWRPYRKALRESMKRGDPPTDYTIPEEAERAHWRAVTMNLTPPSGWADKISEALVKRKDKDFKSEYRRTMALAQDAVRAYGLAGFRAVWPRVHGEGVVLPLSELPTGEPWHALAALPPREAVQRLFPEGHCIADVLASRLRAIFAVERDGKFQLLYLLDAFGSHYVDGEKRVSDIPAFVIANPPTSQDALDAYATERDWTLPAPLRTLYTVHNGLGPNIRIDAGSIEPLERLRVLGEMMNPIVLEQDDVPEDYRYDDLLGFYQDGSGNGQYFHRTTRELTCFWDHETRQIGTPVSFENFCRDCLPEVWIGQTT